MSVLICDMDMPKSCLRCPMEHYYDDGHAHWCSFLVGRYQDSMTDYYRESGQRRPNCPLKEIAEREC